MTETSVTSDVNESGNHGPELLKTVQLSNPAAWVERYGDYLLRYAMSYVRHKHAAEDLVQETFLAALRSRSSFVGESSERTWLIGILKHKIIDYFRANRRTNAFSDFSEEEDACNHEELKRCSARATSDATVSEWHANPAARTEQEAFWTVLQQCLSKISPRMASAFSLREVEQLETKEICESLNISEANLWVMLHRARACLRQCLQSNWLNKVA